MARGFTYLHYLPAFEAVTRLGSIRRAAAELNLSPSAISLQIKKLGEATGLSLFEKVGRNICLTPAGLEFSQTVSVALGQLDGAAISARKSETSLQAGSLSISVPTALGIAWVSAALVEFAENHDIANLRINEAMNAAEVDWDANDLAIVYDNPPFPRKTWTSLSEVKLSTVCSPVLFPHLKLQHRDRKLSGITLLHEDDGGEWSRWAVAARISLQGSRKVRVASVAQAVASTVQGHGLALMSDVLTRNYLSEGRLIQPFRIGIKAARQYYFLWPEDRAEHPLTTALVDHIRGFLQRRS